MKQWFWPVVVILFVIYIFSSRDTSSTLSATSLADTEATLHSEPPAPAATEVAVPVEIEQATKLTRVIDGDTIEAKINGKTERVRLIGIDTPELGDERETVRCLANMAKKALSEYLEDQFTLETDSTVEERDKYKRLLAYAVVGTDNINLAMIQAGYAKEYTYDSSYRYQAEFREAERQARSGQKGLWNANSCPAAANSTVDSSDKQTTNVKQLDTSGDKDCGDFATHAEAQDYFVAKGGSATNNVDRLDSDHDGLVCESLGKR